MRPLTRLQKIFVGVGCGGAIVYFSNQFDVLKTVHTSWTTGYVPSPCGKWDKNWDHRCPKSLVKPPKNCQNETDNNILNEELEKYTPKAYRHIIMVRHGQYEIEGQTDRQRILTKLGRRQAEFTGKRLKELKVPFTNMITSTMARAEETGDIIKQCLPDVPLSSCSLLIEGAPIPPEPPIGHWRPEKHKFFQDGARIEAAFRQYFHRADPCQKEDSYTLLVCHANVIRYFICRALQFPAEGWLRLSLNHASITWMTISPSGRIVLKTLGDSGHMPPELLTKA